MAEERYREKTRGRPFVIGTILVLIAGGYLLYRFDLSGMLKSYLDHVHPAVFIALMAFLPVVGASISAFLVLVGMKFGIAAGILLSAVLMFFHMALTYYLVHSFLRDRINRLLQRFRISMPTLISNYTIWQAVIFMLIPGVPYAVKNNVLALAGYGFVPYMTISWSTQYGRGIPLIVLGGAFIEMDLAFLGIALALLLIVFLVQQNVKQRIRARRSRDS